MKLKTIVLLSVFFVSFIVATKAQQTVPSVYSNIAYDENGKLYILENNVKLYEDKGTSGYNLEDIKGNPHGTNFGILFDFNNPDFNGTLYFGLIPYGEGKHPQPVYFRTSAPILKGFAAVNIFNNLRGKYDMVGWEKSGKGTLGYRILNSTGVIIYDGIVTFNYSDKPKKGKFKVDITITEGPFVNIVNSNSAVITFETNKATKATIETNGKNFFDEKAVKHHEIKISGLKAATEYDYKTIYGDNQQTYSFKTSPEAGSRKPFTFAYVSDSRTGSGGGERNVFGVNYYIMKKIAAIASFNKIAFMQFTGDLINGYSSDKGEMNLQYANWKRSVEPFAHYFPIYAAMGNHEALVTRFESSGAEYGFTVDKFPFATESAEYIFSQNFVNPQNGPESEDGAVYDPDDSKIDFPTYKENAFSYIYDNVAVIVLNSNYLYAPSLAVSSISSGNLHGYIMDKQLEWLEKQITEFEQNTNIDHVFISQHTPAFPNGGHVNDDMYYGGNNEKRPYIAGKPLKKGILERRDEYLNIIINKSTKVIAILTGDEHNYNKLKISPTMDMYPQDFKGKKLILSRTIYQVNNGAAGAPYYAQEQTPWSNALSGFSTQNAIVFFDVDGKNIKLRVVNPDTLEPIDGIVLR